VDIIKVFQEHTVYAFLFKMQFNKICERLSKKFTTQYLKFHVNYTSICLYLLATCLKHKCYLTTNDKNSSDRDAEVV